MSATADGGLVMAGETFGAVDFGDGLPANAREWDAFVVKVPP